MRPLPGRARRSSNEEPRASVTRSNARADQRRRLLRAVGELVAERGYADVTVEQIVKRARVSAKTFYKHFASKEECFVAFFEGALSATEGTIRQRLAAEPSPWAGQVVLALRTLVQQIAAEPVLARAVLVEFSSVGPSVVERYVQTVDALIRLFRRGREFNPRGEEMPSTLEDALAGSVLWSAYEYLVTDNAAELPDHLPVLIELVLRPYIGQPEARRLAQGGKPDREPALA